MSKFWYCLALSTLPCLTAPANAEVISQNAADLLGNHPLETNYNQPKDLSQNNSQSKQNSGSRIDDPELQQQSYWYVSGGANIIFPGDLTGNTLVNGTNLRGTIDLNNSLQPNIALGYQLQGVGRIELELGYASFGINSFTLTVPGASDRFSVNGDTRATTLLVNGYWDVPTQSKLRPYIGVGAGITFLSFSDATLTDANGETDVVPGDSNSSFTWQGKVGISYEVAPKGNIYAELKYLNIGSTADYDSTQAVGVGIGYRLGF